MKIKNSSFYPSRILLFHASSPVSDRYFHSSFKWSCLISQNSGLSRLGVNFLPQKRERRHEQLTQQNIFSSTLISLLPFNQKSWLFLSRVGGWVRQKPHHLHAKTGEKIINKCYRKRAFLWSLTFDLTNHLHLIKQVVVDYIGFWWGNKRNSYRFLNLEWFFWWETKARQVQFHVLTMGNMRNSRAGGHKKFKGRFIILWITQEKEKKE
jgi:hypothetical protein